MADSKFLPPVEIPWKFVGTTVAYTAWPPNAPTEPVDVSLFAYVPTFPDGESPYGEDRIVYFKISLSINTMGGFKNDWALRFNAGLPVKHLTMDIWMHDKLGKKNPYFIDISPKKRNIVQTGVIGSEIYEGSSNQISIGKSNTTLHEESSSDTTVSSHFTGVTIPLLFGYSYRKTNTHTNSDRTVNQNIDTINRNASEERKELLSHTTNVENLMSLLNVKNIGSKFLNVRLSPQPLSMASLDQSDPDLWYTQFLRYLSSGLEGMQDFVAVAVVPKGVDEISFHTYFCAYGFLDKPTIFHPNYSYSNYEIQDFLNNKYPKGTPLLELDIDTTKIQNEIDKEGGQFPCIQNFEISGYGSYVWKVCIGYNKDDFSTRYRDFVYKTWLELAYDLSVCEFEKELAKHPIERGEVVQKERAAHFTVNVASISPAEPKVDSKDFQIFDTRGMQKGNSGLKTQANGQRGSIFSRPTNDISRWNLIDSQLANSIASIEGKLSPLTYDNTKLRENLFNYWSRLDESDDQNMGIDSLKNKLGLTDKEVETLKKAGVGTLSDLGNVLKEVPLVEKINKDFEKTRKTLPLDLGKKIKDFKPRLEKANYSGILKKVVAVLNQKPS